MLRAFFLAIGIFVCFLGVECMLIDKAIFATGGGSDQTVTIKVPSLKEVIPPEWAPWILMSAGIVVILYSFAIPKRVKE